MSKIIEALEKDVESPGLYQEIIDTLAGCGAVLPLIIWTPAYKERRFNGEWGAVLPGQRDSVKTYGDAALMFLGGMFDTTRGDKLIMESRKIVDADGRVVYQLPAGLKYA